MGAIFTKIAPLLQVCLVDLADLGKSFYKLNSFGVPESNTLAIMTSTNTGFNRSFTKKFGEGSKEHSSNTSHIEKDNIWQTLSSSRNSQVKRREYYNIAPKSRSPSRSQNRHSVSMSKNSTFSNKFGKYSTIDNVLKAT